MTRNEAIQREVGKIFLLLCENDALSLCSSRVVEILDDVIVESPEIIVDAHHLFVARFLAHRWQTHQLHTFRPTTVGGNEVVKFGKFGMIVITGRVLRNSAEKSTSNSGISSGKLRNQRPFSGTIKFLSSPLPSKLYLIRKGAL